MGWVLVASLASLRDEFDALAPDRDRASDGSIGDAAHQAEPSDHNPDDTPGVVTPFSDPDSIPEVHAIDVDSDLRKAGWSMGRAVDIIAARHQAGLDNRLQYIIYSRKIASRSWGWTWRDYTGADPHTGHAHFSARYGSGSTGNPENDVRPWGLLKEDDMDATEMTAWAKSPAGQQAIAAAVWGAKPWASDYSTAVALQNGYRNTVTVSTAIAQLDQVDEQALGAVVVSGLLDPLKAAILAGLPEDLDAAMHAAVAESVEAAVENIRLSVVPAPVTA